MRKIIQFSVLLIAANLIFVSVSAQLPKALVFGNVTYANPSGSFKDVSNYGIGYELGGGIGFGKTILIGSVGHMQYHIPNPTPGGLLFESPEPDIKFTPIKVGIRRYLLLGLFVNGNLGMAIRKWGSTEKVNYFLYEAGAGYKLGFFEVGAAYTGYSSSGRIKVNALLLKAGLAIKI
ncbi:MAG: hypothetical protein V4557_13925 [Bacteroidota bacterium]